MCVAVAAAGMPLLSDLLRVRARGGAEVRGGEGGMASFPARNKVPPFSCGRI